MRPVPSPDGTHQGETVAGGAVSGTVVGAVVTGVVVTGVVVTGTVLVGAVVVVVVVVVAGGITNPFAQPHRMSIGAPNGNPTVVGWASR